MIPEEKVAKRIDELIEISNGTWETSVDQIAFGFNVATLISSFLGPNHSIVQNVDKMIAQYTQSPSVRPRFPLERMKGVLTGFKSDFEGGHFADFRGIIRTEVEADFLAQALRLLDDGCKDSAAMLIGAVLEDALRQLCRTHGVPEGNGIEKMNPPLRTAGIYGLPQQQQITAWAAIRNKAAHGKFEEYVIEEIRLMHQGISSFLVNYLGR